MLSFLRARLREGDLLPTVEGIDYMLRLGVDPVRQLLLLRSRLEDLRNEMESARRLSDSEVILRDASARLQDALELSERIRAVLTRVPLEMAEARHAAQDVHELLSRLHGVGSDLHAAITEIGRQYLHLVGGLTTADIIATLMQLPVEELDNAAKAAMRPMVPQTSLRNTRTPWCGSRGLSVASITRARGGQVERAATTGICCARTHTAQRGHESSG